MAGTYTSCMLFAAAVLWIVLAVGGGGSIIPEFGHWLPDVLAKFGSGVAAAGGCTLLMPLRCRFDRGCRSESSVSVSSN